MKRTPLGTFEMDAKSSSNRLRADGAVRQKAGKRRRREGTVGKRKAAGRGRSKLKELVPNKVRVLTRDARVGRL